MFQDACNKMPGPLVLRHRVFQVCKVSCFLGCRYKCRCSAEPGMPFSGLGIKEAYRPCRWAMVRTIYLKVTSLSAVSRALSTFKAILCCPPCLVVTVADIIAHFFQGQDDVPAGILSQIEGVKSQRPALSWVLMVGLPLLSVCRR